jgi:toxin CcdB
MAQYDVHRLQSGELVLNCQSDFLGLLTTRMVVPLVDPDSVPGPLLRLHPLFEIEGNSVLLATHLAGAVPVGELGYPVASLAQHDLTIGNAIDFLIDGF